MPVKNSEFSPWLCGDQVSWPLRVSVSFSVKGRGGTCVPWWPTSTPVEPQHPPGGKVGLSRRKEGFFNIKVTFLLTKRIFMQRAFQMSLKQRAEMNLKSLTYAFSALSSNYDNLGGYVNYTILVKWHNYEMLGQKQKRITLL